ncbi:hypothetical protein [Jeotgalibacillus marinus]|uniref:DUF2975 domain-containing protein n=1 Tax=Jeotgalibacillus marinus TaxID=86667 RepID=A0ABV3Q5G6_9BACL
MLTIIVVLLFFISISIGICFGVVYLLSNFSFVNFQYYSNFWDNVLFFMGLTVLNLFVLALIEVLITIDRIKVKKLLDLGPTNVKEWILYFLVFIVYMNVFNIYSVRLEATVVGTSFIAICFVTIFVFLEFLLDKIQGEEEQERLEDV